jgi:hypothetical protein
MSHPKKYSAGTPTQVWEQAVMIFSVERAIIHSRYATAVVFADRSLIFHLEDDEERITATTQFGLRQWNQDLSTAHN